MSDMAWQGMRIAGRAALTGLVVGAFGMAAAAAEPTTIEYLVWGNASSDTIEQSVISAFEKEHPDIQVKLINGGGTSYDKLLTSIAADDPPDVAIVDYYNFPSFVQKGLALDVTDWAEQDNVLPALKANLQPGLLGEMQHDGHTYSVANLRHNVDGVTFNKDIFAAAGLPTPLQLGDRWTWDAYRETAKKLTRRDADGNTTQWGAWVHPLFIWSFIRMNGGHLLNADQTQAAFDQPADYEALQWLADMFVEDRSTISRWTDANTFNQGKAGMSVIWVGGALPAGFAADIAPLPAGKLGQISTVKGNEAVIPINAKHPRAAWEFMKFLGSEEAYYLYGSQARFTPMYRSVLQRLVQNGSRNLPANIQMITQVNAQPLPFVPGFNDVQSMWQKALDPVWQGKASAKTVGEEIAAQSVALLAAARGK